MSIVKIISVVIGLLISFVEVYYLQVILNIDAPVATKTMTADIEKVQTPETIDWISVQNKVFGYKNTKIQIWTQADREKNKTEKNPENVSEEPIEVIKKENKKIADPENCTDKDGCKWTSLR